MSKFEFPLELHLPGVEELRYEDPVNLRHEPDELIFQGDCIGTREEVNHPGQCASEWDDIDARRLQVLFSVTLQERFSLQLARQNLQIGDRQAGDVVYRNDIVVAVPVG